MLSCLSLIQGSLHSSFSLLHYSIFQCCPSDFRTFPWILGLTTSLIPWKSVSICPFLRLKFRYLRFPSSVSCWLLLTHKSLALTPTTLCLSYRFSTLNLDTLFLSHCKPFQFSITWLFPFRWLRIPTVTLNISRFLVCISKGVHLFQQGFSGSRASCFWISTLV